MLRAIVQTRPPLTAKQSDPPIAPRGYCVTLRFQCNIALESPSSSPAQGSCRPLTFLPCFATICGRAGQRAMWRQAVLQGFKGHVIIGVNAYFGGNAHGFPGDGFSVKPAVAGKRPRGRQGIGAAAADGSHIVVRFDNIACA